MRQIGDLAGDSRRAAFSFGGHGSFLQPSGGRLNRLLQGSVAADGLSDSPRANDVEYSSLYISAAPWWNRGVTPAPPNVSAISPISPTQRPALAGSPGIPYSMAESASPWLYASSWISSSYSPSASVRGQHRKSERVGHSSSWTHSTSLCSTLCQYQGTMFLTAMLLPSSSSIRSGRGPGVYTRGATRLAGELPMIPPSM